jgi:hypothetical protein
MKGFMKEYNINAEPPAQQNFRITPVFLWNGNVELSHVNLSYPGVVSAKNQGGCPVHCHIKPVPPADHTGKVSRAPNQPANKPSKRYAFCILPKRNRRFRQLMTT